MYRGTHVNPSAEEAEELIDHVERAHALLMKPRNEETTSECILTLSTLEAHPYRLRYPATSGHQNIDRGQALRLILSYEGTITPYG